MWSVLCGWVRQPGPLWESHSGKVKDWEHSIGSKPHCTLVTWALKTCSACPTSDLLWAELLRVKAGTWNAQGCPGHAAKLAPPPPGHVQPQPLLFYCTGCCPDFSAVHEGLIILALKTKSRFFNRFEGYIFQNTHRFCFWFWLCCLMLLWSLNFTTGPFLSFFFF